MDPSFFLTKITERLSTLYGDIDESRAVAKKLITGLLKKEWIELLSTRHITLHPDEERLLEEQLHRLSTYEPIQYILGNVIFNGLQLAISSDVLIPRPETEYWVAWLQKKFQDQPPSSIADFYTGSGCIAISLKRYFSHTQVDGFDLSLPALDLAKRNAIALKADISFHHIDLLTERWPNKNGLGG